MLFSELKKRLSEKTFKIEDLEINIYIPLAKKMVLADIICDNAIEFNEDGLAIVDYLNLEVVYVSSILNHYCNIEHEDKDEIDEGSSLDYLDIFDMLNEQNIIDEIKLAIGKDLDILYNLVMQKIENVKLQHNSVEAVLARGISRLEKVLAEGIDKVVEKLPTDKELRSLSKSFLRDMNKLDWKQFPLLKEMQDVAKGNKNSC